MLNLGFNFEFADLYGREGLQKVDAAFLSELDAADPALHLRLGNARRNVAGLDAKQQSQLLIDLAPHVDDFRRRAVRNPRTAGRVGRAAPPTGAVVRSQAPVRAAQCRQGLHADSAQALAGERLGAELATRIGRRTAKVPRSNWRSRAACCAGRPTKPAARPSSTSRCATPPGRCTARAAGAATTACCSRRRPRSTRNNCWRTRRPSRLQGATALSRSSPSICAAATASS